MVSIKNAPFKITEIANKREVLKELRAGSAMGTRRAVKVEVTSGKSKYTGWISRKFLNWHAVRNTIKPEKVVPSGPGVRKSKKIRSEVK